MGKNLPIFGLQQATPSPSPNISSSTDTPLTRRIVLRPKVGPSGLFVQPDPANGNDVKAQREMVERVNRLNFTSHFHYEDLESRQSASPTYDPNGNYNCGACNKQDGKNACLIIPISVDLKAGSCEHWEIRCASDRELDMSMMGVTAEDAMYGVAKNGEGFGCKRCPFASPAYEPDSVGRTLYCGKGDFRVPPNACCALNGAELVSDPNSK